MPTTSQSAAGLFGGTGAPGLEIYQRIRAYSETLGPVVEEVKKTCIHLVNGSAFVGIHPRKRGVLMTLRTRTQINSPRVRKQLQASANRWYSDVLIESGDEIDDELCAWISEAYHAPFAQR
jgi:hypothetical protein